jgi:hypothetical protein
VGGGALSPNRHLGRPSPRDPAQDFLTRAVIAAIDQDNPPAGSPADEFRTLLQSADARHELRDRVQKYADGVAQRLSGDQRQAELERLFRVLLDRREAMLRHPVLRNLDETDGRLLLPLPASSFRGGRRQATGHEDNR